MAELILPSNISCGYFDCSGFQGLSVSPERTVVRYEIEYYLDDAFSTFVNGQEYKIKRDYIKIACPGQVCNSVLPFTTMYLKFNVSGIVAQMLEDAPTYFRCYHPTRVRELHKRLALGADGGPGMLEHYSNALEILSLVLSDSGVDPSALKSDYNVISNAKAFIRTHYMEQISLTDIAASVNLSTTYFHSVFTSACSMTPHGYLTSVRIKEAKRMLWDTTISLSDVAERCGFTCQQYFSTVFKKEVGMTPTAYRKVNQTNYML